MVIDFKRIEKRRKSLSWQTIGRINVKVLIMISFLVLILLMAQLIFANHLATDGAKLSQVETEIQKVEAENTTLRVKIASVSSLTSLIKKAKLLGFSESSTIINY